MQFYTKCTVLALICAVLTAQQFTAVRCYVPGPAGGANSAPPDLLAGFWGDEKNGKREMKGN